jgi:hypothetical protein
LKWKKEDNKQNRPSKSSRTLSSGQFAWEKKRERESRDRGYFLSTIGQDSTTVFLVLSWKDHEVIISTS